MRAPSALNISSRWKIEFACNFTEAHQLTTFFLASRRFHFTPSRRSCCCCCRCRCRLHVLLSGQADCRSRAESLISREENITKSWRADKDTCRRWHFIPVICLRQSFSRTCDERRQNVASFCDYLKYLSVLFCRTCKADFTSDRVDFENMQPAGL